jgi:hypothetical protein
MSIEKKMVCIDVGSARKEKKKGGRERVRVSKKRV